MIKKMYVRYLDECYKNRIQKQISGIHLDTNSSERKIVISQLGSETKTKCAGPGIDDTFFC